MLCSRLKINIKLDQSIMNCHFYLTFY